MTTGEAVIFAVIIGWAAFTDFRMVRAQMKIRELEAKQKYLQESFVYGTRERVLDDGK